jgi:uncharacterized membrane protein YgdD (TMEM256/DUF423 family)
MTNSTGWRIAAVFCGLAVALGAFGAHALKDLLARNQMTVVWEKAVFYQFVHGLALLVLAGRRPLPICPFIGFVLGILLFSGSLYLLALTQVRWLGAITPFGGVSFLVGWCCLAMRPPAAERE